MEKLPLKAFGQIVKEKNVINNKQFAEPLLTVSQIYSELKTAYKQFQADFKFGAN